MSLAGSWACWNNEERRTKKNVSLFVIRYSLFLWFLRKRPYLGLSLRIRKVPKFRRHTAANRGRLAASLETREVRAIAPRERPAQANARLDRRVVHDVDRALVVRRALAIAGEVAEVAARRKARADAGHLRNLLGVLQTVERFDHQDQDDVVVGGIA